MVIFFYLQCSARVLQPIRMQVRERKGWALRADASRAWHMETENVIMKVESEEDVCVTEVGERERE